MTGLYIVLGIIALVLVLRKLTQSKCVECGRGVPGMCTFTISNGGVTTGPLCVGCMQKLTEER